MATLSPTRRRLVQTHVFLYSSCFGVFSKKKLHNEHAHCVALKEPSLNLEHLKLRGSCLFPKRAPHYMDVPLSLSEKA